jgi:hypothetical protein
MEWFLKLVVIWVSIDVVIIATAWYIVSVIKPHFPNWWRQTIVAEEPEIGLNPEAVALSLPVVNSRYHR